ncbi:MAG: DUF4276 family protein [Magnetococcales bacterium]|nr:DUF4276 family protein [Magnetococcales bacterium]
MIRLHVTAEGQTEKAFVKAVLAPHLANHKVFADARCVLTSKDKRAGKKHRGGLISYSKAKDDILRWTREDKDPACRFTTMFDLYALPDGFPGYADAKGLSDPYQRVRTLEHSLTKDIDDSRFLPYIQLHEFETLIFADPKKLDLEYLEHKRPIEKLVDMVGNGNPELINDGRETAPSKRIRKEIPEYDKAGSGVLVVEKIGVETLRRKCRHFNDWLTGLENLGKP